MDIFYSDIIHDTTIELSTLESHHCAVVLRYEIGSQIQVLDGIGGRYLCEIIDNNKKKVIVDILNKEFHNPKPYKVHLIIAPTKSLDRIEWFVEKSVELGVSKISFIKTQRTERNKININRMNRIVMSAMKQSGQYYLPIINNLIIYRDVISNRKESQLFIAHLEDQDKNKKNNIVDVYIKNLDCCILIGPEGDFTIDEINLAIENNFQSITLGNNRLRTETAGIYAISAIKTLNE